MPRNGTWVPYGGAGAVALAVGLLAVAAAVAYLARRLPRPLEARQPGRATAAFMVALWLLSIATFLVCLIAYVEQIRQDHLRYTAPFNPVTLVTFTAAAVTFIVIAQAGAPRGLWIALTSGAIGAAAAPMIFELPFDLVVMSRTYPPVPPAPALYRLLFFLPLFAVEVSTLALLTLSPMVKLSRGTLAALSAMFVVWAVWALFGFAFPSSPAPIVLNMVSKLLAFVATLTLFLPERAERWLAALYRAPSRSRRAAV